MFVGREAELNDLNPNSALSGKAKELIGLAVAAQVPCQYCIYAHTESHAIQSPVGLAESPAGVWRL